MCLRLWKQREVFEKISGSAIFLANRTCEHIFVGKFPRVDAVFAKRVAASRDDERLVLVVVVGVETDCTGEILEIHCRLDIWK